MKFSVGVCVLRQCPDSFGTSRLCFYKSLGVQKARYQASCIKEGFSIPQLDCTASHPGPERHTATHAMGQKLEAAEPPGWRSQGHFWIRPAPPPPPPPPPPNATYREVMGQQPRHQHPDLNEPPPIALIRPGLPESSAFSLITSTFFAVCRYSIRHFPPSLIMF